MKRQIWKLLWLLTSLMVGCAAKCMDVSRTVALQLSRTQVLRTWQPDGAGCRWWENRISSETDQFPAAVRSGPRWLVMQLRQPMMLEVVSVRGWDGQWQAAAPVGSPVSAVGASSLPLELQLEDPCRASWEVFGNSDLWSHLRESESRIAAPTRFIRLNSESSLNWQSLSIRGRVPTVKLNTSWSAEFQLSRFGLIVSSAVVSNQLTYFYMESRGSNQTACWLLESGRKIPATHVISVPSRSGWSTSKFSLKLVDGDIGKLLQCGFDEQKTVEFEELLLLEVRPKNVKLSVSSVLVVGHPAAVIVSSDSFPETQHRCFISSFLPASQSQQLSAIETSTTRIIDVRNRTSFRIRSQFSFNVSRANENAEIVCPALGVSKRIVTRSEPCHTAIKFGPRRHWLVGETRRISVTSSRCSIWNVSHSCRLLLDDGARHKPLPLRKVQQGSFNSSHELLVVEAMTRSGWRVLCSVNQSGVEQGDSETDPSSSPAVFGEGDKAAIEVHVRSSCLNQTHVEVEVQVALALNKTDTRLLLSCSAVGGGDVTSLFQKNVTMPVVLKLNTTSLMRSNGPVQLVCCTGFQYYSEVYAFNYTKCGHFELRSRSEVDAKFLMGLVLAALAGICCSICALLAAAAWLTNSKRGPEPSDRTSAGLHVTQSSSAAPDEDDGRVREESEHSDNLHDEQIMKQSQRPTARPQAAQQGGGFKGLQAIPLQQVVAATAAAATSEAAPYEIPTSDFGTAEDSEYERVSAGTCSSRLVDQPPPQPPQHSQQQLLRPPQPFLPLPELPSGSASEGGYINWRP